MPSPLIGLGAQRIIDVGTATGSTDGTGIAASASANVKGSYVELYSSIPTAISGFLLEAWGFAATRDYLLDIAIGAGGSEQIIVSNFQLSSGTAGAEQIRAPVFFPIALPAGTRISARVQSTTGSSVVVLAMYLVAGGPLVGLGAGVAVTYGANTGDSGGTSIDPGGSTNTKGAYSEITASTTRAISWLILCIGNQTNGIRSDARWLVDIAVGGAGSEQVIIPNLYVSCTSNSDIPFPQHLALPISIPAGSRIAARAQCTITDATDRLIDLVLIGVG